MNKQKFIDIIRDPSGVEEAQATELQEVLDMFPYFSVGRTILAQWGKIKSHDNSKSWLGSAAVYATDRKHLKRYINGDLIFLADKPKVKSPDPEISVETSGSSNPPTTKETTSTPERRTDLGLELEKLNVPTGEQVDHLLEELERDLEALKKSRMHFVEIQNQIDDEPSVTSPTIRDQPNEKEITQGPESSESDPVSKPQEKSKSTPKEPTFSDIPEPKPKEPVNEEVIEKPQEETDEKRSTSASEESMSNETSKTIDPSFIDALKKSVIDEVEKGQKDVDQPKKKRGKITKEPPAPTDVNPAPPVEKEKTTSPLSSIETDVEKLKQPADPKPSLQTEEFSDDSFKEEPLPPAPPREPAPVPPTSTEETEKTTTSKDDEPKEPAERKPTSTATKSFMDLNETLRKQPITSVSKASSRRKKRPAPEDQSKEESKQVDETPVSRAATRPTLEERESKFNRGATPESSGKGKISFSGSNKRKTNEIEDSAESGENKEQLIDQFIEKNPSISTNKLKESPSGQDLSSGSTTWTDDLATENLAEIYLQQGHKQKAKQIYEALILKFPEKESYFAGLIEKL